VYAIVVGNLSSLVMKQDDEVVAKRAQLELVQGYVGHIRVQPELKQRLMAFFQNRFRSTSLSSITPDIVYKALPMELRIEVAAHTNRRVVDAAALLRNCSSSAIDRLSSLLRERALEPETILFRMAEACTELALVAVGAVETYHEPEPGERLEISETMHFGATVGDMPFIFGLRHTHTARASPSELETKIFTLSTHAYQSLLKAYPGMQDVIIDNTISKHEGACSGAPSLVPRSPLAPFPFPCKIPRASMPHHATICLCEARLADTRAIAPPSPPAPHAQGKSPPWRRHPSPLGGSVQPLSHQTGAAPS
jgi:hypothetical protein